jgi:hypothetical protein
MILGKYVNVVVPGRVGSFDGFLEKEDSQYGMLRRKKLDFVCDQLCTDRRLFGHFESDEMALGDKDYAFLLLDGTQGYHSSIAGEVYNGKGVEHGSALYQPALQQGDTLLFLLR